MSLGIFRAMPDIRREPFFRFSLMVARAAKDEVQPRKTTTRSALEVETLISRSPGHPHQQLIDKQLAQAGTKVKLGSVVNLLDTQIALVEAEEGIAIIPSFGMPACRNRRVAVSQLINPVVRFGFHMISRRGRDDVFNALRDGVVADRSQFWKDLSLPFHGYNRPGAKISEGVRESFWLQSMMAGFPASYFCIKAFSETDLTEDLKRFDVPTLVLHGDDDQIVPYADSALLSSKIIKDAKLVVYKDAPHGMCTTLKERVNEELIGFFKA